MIGVKRFNVMHGVGKAKYVLNVHDGVKTHADGSDFFDIEIFTNKVKLKVRIQELRSAGYAEGF